MLGGLSSTHGVIGFGLRRKEGLASWTRAATICARFGLTLRGGETNATARSGGLRQTTSQSTSMPSSSMISRNVSGGHGAVHAQPPARVGDVANEASMVERRSL